VLFGENPAMNINFSKSPDNLVPAIIQDSETDKVLMLGYMNAEAFEITRATGKVTFFSRSRQTLWTKGETSGNFLRVEEVSIDCDADTLLIKASPSGPTCHTGADTCFGETKASTNILFDLEKIIKDRQVNPVEGSYTSSLFAAGLNRIAQKVGEEVVELIIEAKDSNDDAFCNEAADLIYHLLVLFAERRVDVAEIISTLKERRGKN
jgi:phosphoribosyl-ATP pyrophosphohydrolase/phosphoribosyl-AMP cyclohydrolase